MVTEKVDEILCPVSKGIKSKRLGSVWFWKRFVFERQLKAKKSRLESCYVLKFF